MPPKRATRTSSGMVAEAAAQPRAKRARKEVVKKRAAKRPNKVTIRKTAVEINEEVDELTPERTVSPIITVLLPGAEGCQRGEQRNSDSEMEASGASYSPIECRPNYATADKAWNPAGRNSASSTRLPRIINVQDLGKPTKDPLERFTEAIESTLRTICRDATLGGENSRLVNRLITAKLLPTVSGNPLEWFQFKETFELTYENGGYSERGNVTRLFSALCGKASEAVNTLLATSRDATAVMKTLELHFGNKQVVAAQIVNNLKELPFIDSGKLNSCSSQQN